MILIRSGTVLQLIGPSAWIKYVLLGTTSADLQDYIQIIVQMV